MSGGGGITIGDLPLKGEGEGLARSEGDKQGKSP